MRAGGGVGVGGLTCSLEFAGQSEGEEFGAGDAAAFGFGVGGGEEALFDGEGDGFGAGALAGAAGFAFGFLPEGALGFGEGSSFLENELLVELFPLPFLFLVGEGEEGVDGGWFVAVSHGLYCIGNLRKSSVYWRVVG